MKLGTTPTHNFEIPFSTNLVKDVMVVYAQDDVEILCKTLDDCEMSGNVISTTLTQEETFQFNHKKQVQIQLRVFTNDKKALSSVIFMVDAQRCLNEEVFV